jgi:hypothetical protein
MVGIEQHQKRLVHNRLPLWIGLLDRIAGEPDPQTPNVTLRPVVVRHLLAVRPKPRNILHLRAPDTAALKETAPTEDRMTLS